MTHPEPRTRAQERPKTSHPTLVPPKAPSPAEDPGWAFTFTMAALAAEARLNQEEAMKEDRLRNLEVLSQVIHETLDVSITASELDEALTTAKLKVDAGATGYEALCILVPDYRPTEAAAALAWFGMNQTQPPYVHIEGGLLYVHLDDCQLSFPFDPQESMDRDVYATSIERFSEPMPAFQYLSKQEDSSYDEDMELSDAIDSAMADLCAFAYVAAQGAIDTLNRKEG